LLEYALEGTELCRVILTAYHDLPRLDVDLQLHKKSVWEPENLYLALPFHSEQATLWADKTGCVLRPRVDQIPGSCTDYYCLQNGLAWVSDSASVIVSMPDTPLIAMGALEAHPIRLQGDPAQRNDDAVYAWVMNNFWETNFKASLGGFHQYSYRLELSAETDPQKCLDAAKANNEGVLTFSSYDR
ncbi:MAG: hypothetical protein LBB67_05735, partial [Oscillospiraceae bacterium]|jgi:hypothetical protein|nr:hypothetical protein [Oscillospiraceae bacterium]